MNFVRAGFGGIIALAFALVSPLSAEPSIAQATVVSGGVTVLPFPILDAEFSKALNAIVAVRSVPNQLAIYDPETGSAFGVNLPAIPRCVSVSPDGVRAIVGFDGWISEIDLVGRAVIQTFEVSMNVIEVVHGGNGYAYVFSNDSEILSIHLSSGTVNTTNSWRNFAAARLHPSFDRIYGADRNVSPADLLRLDIAAGPATGVYDSVYHGDYSFCGNVWISEDGLRLFTACGNTFRASSEPSMDMRFAGKLPEDDQVQWVSHSAAANSVAVLPAVSPWTTPRQDGEVHYYAHESLLFRGKFVLPSFIAESKTAVASGRFHFFNAAGTKQYVVVQADEGSGIVNDFGVVTIDCTLNSVSLTPATFDANGDGGQISLAVSGTPGCVWAAQPSVDWLQTTSTGAGDGTVLVNVRPNTTGSSRQATITVGDDSTTITQPPASPGTVVPQPALSALPFSVVDAEFSKSLNAIVAVSEHALHLYATSTRSVTTISLPSAAFCVGVAPDGLFAAVGHSGSISYVDLVNATVVKTLDVSTNVFDVILAGNGYVHAIPRTGSWESIRSVEIATNIESPHVGYPIYAGGVGRLHPAGAWLYFADRGLSPSDIEKFDVSEGPAVGLYDSPYHGDYGMCGNLWFSETGSRFYTACGNVFRSTGDPSTDMTYAGRLGGGTDYSVHYRWASHSAPFGSIAAIVSNSSGSATPPSDREIRYYSPDFFLYQGAMLLPSFLVESTQWQSRGRWHFFSADGTKQHVVVQAPPESGLLYDFGVATIDCSGSGVTLSPAPATVAAGGGTVEISVTGKPGCGWRATESISWLDTLSTGVGDGIAYITVEPNPTFSSRNGTVSIGNKTLTIVQAGQAIGALDAKATSATSVALTWSASVSPQNYEVWRNSGSGFVLIATPTTRSLTDTSAPQNSGLIYRVRGVMSDATATAFTTDYAHTFALTDPVLAGQPVRAVHIQQLRNITNALRTVAGSTAAPFTDPALSGTVAKLVHVTDLRNAINTLRAALGMPSLTFAALTQPVRIRAATTEELRNALQ